MSDIVLSAGVRKNLLALQNTARLMSLTQNRLATGKKVNSALDNPVNFFTASGLNSRAGDLSALLDSMSNGIKTIEAANNGVTAINSTIESMKSTLLQARQDKSFKTTTYTIDAATIGNSTIKNLTFSGGAIGSTPVNVGLNDTSAATQPLLTAGAAFTPLDMTTGDETYNFNVTVDGGTPVAISLGAADNTGGGTTLTLAETIAGINADLATANSDVRVRDSVATPGNLEFYVASGTHTGSGSTIAVGSFANGGTTPTATTAFGFGASATDAGDATGTNAGTPRTVDDLIAAINSNASLAGKVQASNDNGKLRISNQSTADLAIAGINASGAIDGSAATATIGGDDVRRNLVKQFNDLRDQLDKLADDASYNGVNLLRGDKLRITFNETATSTIEIQAKDEFGMVRPVNSINLNIQFLQNSDVDADGSYRHAPRQLEPIDQRRPIAGVGFWIEANDRRKSYRLHQNHDQHAADRRRQPRTGRYQRGRRQHAGAADTSAVVDDRPVAGHASRARPCCACSASEFLRPKSLEKAGVNSAF